MPCEIEIELEVQLKAPEAWLEILKVYLTIPKSWLEAQGGSRRPKEA